MVNAFLAGVYLTVAVFMFGATMFGVFLGGKSDDLWKPFVYGPLWPFFGCVVAIKE